jgi:cytochrome c biogenesis protein CcdA
VTGNLIAEAAGSFAAGIASGAGPCAASRMVALAALGAIRSGERLRTIAPFVSGSVLGCLAIGSGIWSLALLTHYSPWVDSAAGIALLALGSRWLLWPGAHRCSSHAVRGGAFFAGASSAAIISPCCTPYFAAVASAGRWQQGDLAVATVLIAAFAVGHSAPPVLGVLAGARACSVATSTALSSALRVVGATLSFFTGAFYLCIA